MKKYCLLTLLILLWAHDQQAQDLRLRKGVILENLPLEDSVGSELSLYLPTSFEATGKWPLLFLTPSAKDTRKALQYFAGAAEENGYILASTTALDDSLSLTDKVLSVSKSIRKLDTLLPIDRRRTYVGGYEEGAELANLMPNLLQGISGVLAVASGPPNGDLLSSQKSFHYVGILNRADYHYPVMLDGEVVMDQRGIPNSILYFEGDQIHPEPELLGLGLRILTLKGMAGGQVAKDTAFITREYQSFLEYTAALRDRGHFLIAYDQLEEGIAIFDDLTDIGAMKDQLRSLRRLKGYRAQRREAGNLRFKESVIREDYIFYMEEDVLSFNLDNLGWWRYQMGRIDKYKESWKTEEQLLGRRLQGFVNALIEDYMRLARSVEPMDEDALILLHMMRTITQPDAPESYLRVISLTSKYGDYGTALFYLEELLKTGYSDRAALYEMEHTALLRISPEFNALIEKYLEASRYQIPEPPDGEPN